MTRDTIFALSSGSPPAAIAVVRISGPEALPALRQLGGAVPEPRVMALRAIRHPRTMEVLDRALVVQFPAEMSVTGEDLVELHLHGGRAVVRGIEEMLASLPLIRAARSGEFTWRAFENGKLDLVQVELLSDLLRAETQTQRRAALAGNALSSRIEKWRQEVLRLSALVEATIDHSDEDDVRPAEGVIEHGIMELREDMAGWLALPTIDRLFDGIRIAIAGPPNAGKSTLLNALAGREAAITSAIAGTTRDVIEVPVAIEGVPFVLIDMAGLRENSVDTIEQIGISRARTELERADLTLWLGAADPLTVRPDVIWLRSKADLQCSASQNLDDASLPISAVTGIGMENLVRELLRRARALLPGESEGVLTRRQRNYIGRCFDLLSDNASAQDELIRAEQLRRVRAELDALTGQAGTEELLDALFSTFCIGK